MWRPVLYSAVLFMSQASDSCDDEESLLQARVGPKHQAVQQEFDPAALLESVKTMSHKTTENPEEVTDAMTAVRNALDLMKPRLQSDQDAAQLAIDNQFAEVEACHAHEDHGSSATGGHATELAAINQCIADTNTACGAQDDACERWHAHAALVVFPAITPSSSSEEIYTVANNWRLWIEDQWEELDAKRTACNEATTFCTTETARCEPLIAEYDSTFCEHKIACTLLTACHQHEVEVLDALIAASAAGVTSRQNQFETIKQVECIVDLIEAALAANTTVTDTALGACDDREEDMSHLTLSEPTPPGLPECPAAQEGDPECPAVELPLAWEGGAMVTTTPPPIVSGDLRIVDGTESRGRLEIFHNNEWGTICDDGFAGYGAPDLACHLLGFPRGAIRAYTHRGGTGQIWLDDVLCTRNAPQATTLKQCTTLDWGRHNCGHNEDVGVECNPNRNPPEPATEGNLRLADITVRDNGQVYGRLEIAHNDEWGTICDDGFNSHGGMEMACAALGYSRAIRSYTHAGGQGQIWLDNVMCTRMSGNPQTLKQCTDHAWGQHNCGHHEDVGVECAP